MIVYLAGNRSIEKVNKEMRAKLFSFFYYNRSKKIQRIFNFWTEQMKKENSSRFLFLDSGAFSAYSRKAMIDIDEYGKFISENRETITTAANLDVIGNPRKTWENQKILESMGVEILPTYHYGENIKWLKKYIDNYEYIALGGLVPINKREKIPWLNDIFSNYICDSNGYPIIKIHGFGISGLELALRYPFYSLDSTEWLLKGAMGKILIPRNKNGVRDYSQVPHSICVVYGMTNSHKFNQHICHLSPKMKKFVQDYIEEKGCKLGLCRKINGCNKIIMNGLTTHYQYRDIMNIKYFNDLMNYYPKWPTKFEGQRLNKTMFD